MKFVLGNWKMHGLRTESVTLVKSLAGFFPPDGVQVAVFPPFTSLDCVADSGLNLGGQDCSPEPSGAFTGDISAAMLKDAGCKYVLVGHSERRQYHHETDALVRAKAEAALQAGITPVICVGESLAERQAGIYLEVISKQVRASVPNFGEKSGSAATSDQVGAQPLAALERHQKHYIIAYEPVWAIGSGSVPTLAEITEVHKTIASVLSCATSGALAAIIYGGSVKSGNAADILHAEGVDGVLVGGASLNAQEFQLIISAAQQK